VGFGIILHPCFHLFWPGFFCARIGQVPILMDDPLTPPTPPNEEDSLSKTQPRKRIRRLLEGSEVNDASMNQATEGDSLENQPAPQASQAAPVTPSSPNQPVQEGQTSTQTLPLPPVEQVLPAAEPPPAEEHAPEEANHATLGPEKPLERNPEQIFPGFEGQTAARLTRRPAQHRPGSETNPLPAFPEHPTLPSASQRAPTQSGSLPRRVEEVDANATQVTPAAYQQYRPPESGRLPGGNIPPRGAARAGAYPQQAPRPRTGVSAVQGAPQTIRRSVGVGAPPTATGGKNGKRAGGWKRSLGCAMRLVVGLLFTVVFVIVAAGSWLVFQYFSIARSLPPVSELSQKASKFETTRIYDRNGGVLYEIIDPNAGRRTFVPLDHISPYLVAATIATEDREYYNHPGFDPIAIARAFYQNYTTGEVVSGASTITQQLARMLLLSPDERYERSYERKAREIVLAAEITRNYSKDEILELYLNEANYANLAYGVEAAAETYFGTTAEALPMGQAALLAGLPQSPGVYDIYTNLEAPLARQKQVVLLMLEASQQKGCITVSNSPEPVCVDELAAIQAVQEMEVYQFQKAPNSLRFPHWVNYIRSLLESQYDPETIYRSGFNVYTTLDPEIQERAQEAVSQQVKALEEHNAYNGALVAIRPATGEILAMVGSPDFNDKDHAGEVNMAISPRQPGSSIKPLTYVAAFEKGWTPSTLIWDVPSEFPPSGDPNDTREPYKPVNYDERYHGPVTVRTALANSYNIPAVKALQYIGIYNEGGLIPFARRWESLPRPRGIWLVAHVGRGRRRDLARYDLGFGGVCHCGKRCLRWPSQYHDYKATWCYEYKRLPGNRCAV
jgi:hypothetical protein